MRHGSLFSGIGGFDLAAEWMGWNNIFHCEWEEFPRKVLNYHFPKAISYGDITKTDFNVHRGRVDILTGGFPCQPYSAAGKRLGTDDERHLWPEMLRAIREIQPRWVVGENVRGLTNWNGGLVFDEVQADLENEGYEVTPYLLPACGVGAPHRRDRIWFVAYANSNGLQRGDSENEKYASESGFDALNDVEPVTVTYSDKERFQPKRGSAQLGRQRPGFSDAQANPPNWQDFPTQPPVRGGNDGLPEELDSITFPKWRNESIKAYGNAIVPQVAYQIFKAIDQYD